MRFTSKWFHFPHVKTNWLTVYIGVIFISVNNSKNNATNVCRNNKSLSFLIALFNNVLIINRTRYRTHIIFLYYSTN